MPRHAPAGYLLAGALVVFAVWLWPNTSGIASGADQASYLGLARSLAAGKLTEPLPRHPALASAPVSPWAFVPLGFAPVAGNSAMASVYPPGLPAFYALAYRVVGEWETAARLVSLVHAILALVFCYRLGRAWGLSRWLAATVTASLALNPISVRYFMFNMSDGPAMTWALATMYFATRSRKSTAYGAWAGICFGLGVAVRPTNVLLLVALFLILPKNLGTFARFSLAAFGVVVPVLFFNAAQFGGPFQVGYGDVLWRFKARYFLPRAWHFLLWLGRFFTPFVFLGIIAAVVLERTNRKARLFLYAGIVWFATFFVFYALYWFSKDAWWSLRFLLPGLPGLLLASAQGFAGAVHGIRLKPHRVAGSALVAVAVFASSLFWLHRLRVPTLPEEEKKWRQAAQEAGRRYQVVLCGELSGSVFFYSRANLIRFDRLRQPELSSLLTRLPSEAKIGALLSPGEVKLTPRLLPGLLGDCVPQGPFHLCEVNRPQ